MDQRLLDILCCPVTKSPLRRLNDAELAALNSAIASPTAVLDQAGTAVTHAIPAALITRDGRTVYRIDDGIPVMLADQGIATAQLPGFPRA